jgi:hypothetical protein
MLWSMTETAVIDLRDRANPPPDDPENAPFGFRWDTRKKEWVVKRSAGGRKSGAGWLGRKAEPAEPDGAEPDDEGGQQARRFQGQDPEPAHMTHAVKVPRAAVKVPKKVKDDMAGAIGMIGMVLLPVVQSRDPYCGQALTEQYEPIANALIPLLCKSQTVVSFFGGDSDWMLWVQLVTACAPVFMAVTKHHVIRSVSIEQDPETGDLYAVPRDFSAFSTDAETDDAPDEG